MIAVTEEMIDASYSVLDDEDGYDVERAVQQPRDFLRNLIEAALAHAEPVRFEIARETQLRAARSGSLLAVECNGPSHIVVRAG